MTPKVVFPEVQNVSKDAERDFVKVFQESDDDCEVI